MGINLQQGYRDLLQHSGHAVKCIVYGDEKNPDGVALECDTCGCVLVSYDHPGEYEPTDLRVAEVSILIGPVQEEVDELVHELVSMEASAINNGDTEGQARFLIEQLGMEEAVRQVSRL